MNATTVTKRTLQAEAVRARAIARERAEYRRRNLPRRIRNWRADVFPHVARLFSGVAITSSLSAVIFRADGEHYRADDPRLMGVGGTERRASLTRCGFERHGSVFYGPDCSRVDLGIISKRVITTAGVNFLTDAFQNLTEAEVINFHAMGTGAVAEAIGDTALGTEVETRATGTQSEPAANQYRTVGTITATATRAITEHGLMTASTAGTLYDRSVFTVINLLTNDSIQFTHTTTTTAGG